MTAPTHYQRDRALKLYGQYYRSLAGREFNATDILDLRPAAVKAWLELEEFVLQSHTCEPMWRPTTTAEIQPGWMIRSRDVVDGGAMGSGIAHHQNAVGDWYTESGRLLTYDVAGWTCETTAPKAKTDSRIQAWHTIAKHPFFADCYATEGTLLDAMIDALDAADSHTCESKWREISFKEIQPGWEVRAFDGDGAQATWDIAHDQGSPDNWLSKGGYLVAPDEDGWTYETTAPLPKPDPRIQVVVDWTGEPHVATRHEDAIELLARLDALKEGEQS